MYRILQKKKKVIYFIPKTPYDREKNSYSTYIFIKGFLGHFLLVILYPLSKTKKKWKVTNRSKIGGLNIHIFKYAEGKLLANKYNPWYLKKKKQNSFLNTSITGGIFTNFGHKSLVTTFFLEFFT